MSATAFPESESVIISRVNVCGNDKYQSEKPTFLSEHSKIITIRKKAFCAQVRTLQ